ncbi:hypothetical protein ABT115_09405 [Streptomyces sp. NPDC001832]|uniref:hypothetical protein n=1 Tax=Streptomyces sp. NPDC001832 TaxID=3154527 RepID=UPI0033179399
MIISGAAGSVSASSDRLGPDRAEVIDAGVSAAAVVRMPERHADSTPSRGRRPRREVVG